MEDVEEEEFKKCVDQEGEGHKDVEGILADPRYEWEYIDI